MPFIAENELKTLAEAVKILDRIAQGSRVREKTTPKLSKKKATEEKFKKQYNLK